MYEVIEGDLLDDFRWESVGGEGSGKEKLCLEGEEWGALGVGEYEFTVQGTSALFGTTTNASYSFSISSSESSRSSLRQENNGCDPTLWDDSPSSIYGIQTFPSGQTLLPSTLRSTPLLITAKALSPCSEIGMSKSILPPSTLSWSIVGRVPLGLVGVDINDWAEGTQLTIPVSYLQNRDAFPINETVGFQVTAEFGEGAQFSAETFVQFLAAGIDVVTDPIDMSSIIVAAERLVIDLRGSSTDDGLTIGEVFNLI